MNANYKQMLGRTKRPKKQLLTIVRRDSRYPANHCEKCYYGKTQELNCPDCVWLEKEYILYYIYKVQK